MTFLSCLRFYEGLNLLIQILLFLLSLTCICRLIKNKCFYNNGFIIRIFTISHYNNLCVRYSDTASRGSSVFGLKSLNRVFIRNTRFEAPEPKNTISIQKMLMYERKCEQHTKNLGTFKFGTYTNLTMRSDSKVQDKISQLKYHLTLSICIFPYNSVEKKLYQLSLNCQIY